jgi:hypothetical protein
MIYIHIMTGQVHCIGGEWHWFIIYRVITCFYMKLHFTIYISSLHKNILCTWLVNCIFKNTHFIWISILIIEIKIFQGERLTLISISSPLWRCVGQKFDVGDWKILCWWISSTFDVCNVSQKCTLFPFLSSKRTQTYVTICGNTADC